MWPGDPISTALFPKARRAVLGLLYGHPDQSYYLRQIVDLTGLGVGHVQREVNRLAEAGILHRSNVGRHVFFQADETCPIYKELHGIVTRTVGGAAVIAGALQPLADRIDVAFIFGSVARGEERQASDLDLMVVGDVTFAELADAMRAAEGHIRRNINVTVYPAKELRDKLASGRHFLTTVMRQEKIFVLGNEHELEALLGQPMDS